MTTLRITEIERVGPRSSKEQERLQWASAVRPAFHDPRPRPLSISIEDPDQPTGAPIVIGLACAVVVAVLVAVLAGCDVGGTLVQELLR